jgi:hypothetical protein
MNVKWDVKRMEEGLTLGDKQRLRAGVRAIPREVEKVSLDEVGHGDQTKPERRL